MQQARTGNPGAGVFLFSAQIDITEIIMLISEGIKIPPTISERHNEYQIVFALQTGIYADDKISDQRGYFTYRRYNP